ncbi:hypothetical protein V6N11_008048 [Hibiscus sabdariffa]|uniref:RNase H type-1 domain-containing protein n=1 Tax=Hibiscus sabdariffa TaxID=183260 RepID=A0ABR2PZH0_9ROSI
MDVNYVFRGDFLLCCERLAREYVAEFHKPNMAVSRTTRVISHWTKPPVGWVKANSDAVVRSSDSLAAAGGVLLETNNAEVALILQGRSDAIVGCFLVDSIFLLLAHSWSVCICHIPRTQNVIADRVVALCCGSSVVSMTFDSVPVALTELVHKEVAAG